MATTLNKHVIKWERVTVITFKCKLYSKEFKAEFKNNLAMLTCTKGNIHDTNYCALYSTEILLNRKKKEKKMEHFHSTDQFPKLHNLKIKFF